MGEKAGKYCQKGMRYLRVYGMSGFTKKILKMLEVELEADTKIALEDDTMAAYEARLKELEKL